MLTLTASVVTLCIFSLPLRGMFCSLHYSFCLSPSKNSPPVNKLCAEIYWDLDYVQS